MQISILVGFAVGFGSLVVSILIDSHGELHAILAFFNFSAMLIIFGGIAGTIIVSFPVNYLKEVPVALRKAFLHFKDIDTATMCDQLLNFSQKSRQEGILSLEAEIAEVKDAWLKRGLQLVVDGLDRSLVEGVLETEFEEYEKHVRIGSKVFQALGGYAPTLGIIGTVMGLVHMLANLADASNIGAAISVAFLATFWGILTANLIFLPIYERVKAKDNEIITARQAMIIGILSIQAGESVRILEEKFKTLMTHEDLERFNLIRFGSKEK